MGEPPKAREIQTPVLSPVDYGAWSRGYMPPSEHILIDQLMYRGAKVRFSTDDGNEGAFWLVTRGKKIKRGFARKIMELLIECWEEPEQLGTGSESATGPTQCATPSPAREQSDGTNSALPPTAAMVDAGARSIGNSIKETNQRVRATLCWLAMKRAQDCGVCEEPIPLGKSVA